MGKKELQFDISCHQMKASSPRIHLIELLAKGFHGNHQTNMAISKIVGGSPQMDCKATFLKTTPIQHIDHGEISLLSTKKHYFYIFASLVQKCMLTATKRKS